MTNMAALLIRGGAETAGPGQEQADSRLLSKETQRGIESSPGTEPTGSEPRLVAPKTLTFITVSGLDVPTATQRNDPQMLQVTYCIAARVVQEEERRTRGLLLAEKGTKSWLKGRLQQ
jgi:hypothetical protein